MNKYILFLICLAAGGVACAQDTTGFSRVVPRHAIRFSPFHLINFYPTLQLGYETRLSERVTLYLEGGYVVRMDNYDDQDFRDKRGFKAKIEPRYYMTVNRKGTFTSYLATEFYYNHVNFDRTRRVTECFDLECQNLFQRNYLYKVRYREPGFGFKYGIMVYVNNFFFDFNSGFAIRFISYEEPPVSGQPQWGEDDVVGFFDLDIPNQRSRTGFMPLLGIRTGYRFR